MSERRMFVIASILVVTRGVWLPQYWYREFQIYRHTLYRCDYEGYVVDEGPRFWLCVDGCDTLDGLVSELCDILLLVSVYQVE